MPIQEKTSGSRDAPAEAGVPSPPTISLPKGGGAIRGIGEKFGANLVTGTGSMKLSIATSRARSEFGPQFALSYDSGAGNGPYGFGCSLGSPQITRKTDKALPRYIDFEDSDVFILSGAEDLVLVFKKDVAGNLVPDDDLRTVDGVAFRVRRYRPRIEGLFARIERWTRLSDGDVYWRSISRENITTLYGKTSESRIADPADATRVFSWLICESYDDKGNAIVYGYEVENSDGVDSSQANEANRSPESRSANRYLKRVKYGNRAPNRDAAWNATDPALLSDDTWMFEVVFDYGEHDSNDPKPDDSGEWLCRHDPFSSYRAGFEVRTYRLCQRILMFHHFPGEDNVGRACLVRSTDLVYRDIRNNPEDRTKGHPIASFIASVTQSGYKRQPVGGYLKKSLPPVEFTYSEAEINEEVQEVDSESLENLPCGLDGSTYQWVDLDGEGISGILTEQADGWFYKRNTSPTNRIDDHGHERTVARFAPVELVAAKPAASLAGGEAQFMDLAGDGQVDLVQLGGPLRGFYERTDAASWEPFRAFAYSPSVDLRDPNLKFIDLNGDGHADILISEDDVFCWYPSLGEEGFGPSARTPKARDEEKGPNLVFADGEQAIYLADMSGDGLTDLVRVRNGSVCYWSNRGHCRFGPKVSMDGAPWFDAPDLFDQRRVRLGDIDGSGTTDIFYLHQDGIIIWRNQSGNSWSEPQRLSVFPPTDNLTSVTVVDLLGNGTACLVWSSPLPGDIFRPMRYIDLMGGQKPHLLIKTANNLGAETVVHYAPSTKFYLQDKFAGQPWITKLPFPVHVVERVETIDCVSRNRFVTNYSYHHGDFDGEEREFRGFGMVEQRDTEEFAVLSASELLPDATNIDAASHVPPVYTKTWFHTGAHMDSARITKQFEHEYYREGDTSLGESGLTDTQLEAMLLPDTVLPDDLAADEEREACRALKGSILRIETYAEDGKEESDRPYSVSERNYTIEHLQPRGQNQHAVFFTHPRESIDFHYERKLYNIQGKQLADPRVSHSMTLKVDEFGNILRSAAVAYGRRHPDLELKPEDQEKQQRTHLTFTENRFTVPVLEDDAHRAPLPCESRTYELLKTTPVNPPDQPVPEVTNLFRFEKLEETIDAVSDGNHDLLYNDWDIDESTLPAPHRRLIEHVRSLYRANNLTGPKQGLLGLAQLESLALPGESYKLAFTPELLAQIYKRKLGASPEENLLPNPAQVLGGKGSDHGGYVLSDDQKALGLFPASDPDAHWWIPSGRSFQSRNSDDTAAQELTETQAHFFLPRRFQDPFLNNAFVDYDSQDLLLIGTEDALQNTVTSENDYRVLQPRLVTDPNGNRSHVAFDTLGLIAGTAVMAKASGPVEGDLLDASFTANLTQAQVDAFIAQPRQPGPTNSESQATPIVHELLANATTRIIYDLERFSRTREANPDDPEMWEPPFAATIAREMHVSDLPANQQSKLQISFSYSDGFGREIQKKISAEPGPLDLDDPSSPIVNPRWVGSGWTIFNNKGKPVRQYEPFFSPTHEFEFAKQVGVSPVLFYDPVERVVATLHPNHTWEKVVFDPWQQTTYDVNDTVLNADGSTDPKSDEDVKGFFSLLPDPDYLPTWLEQRIALAADDPERIAADKAIVHRQTPTVAHFDTLGRPFLTIAHNRFGRNDAIVEEKYPARLELDIEGNPREVIDALGRIVMRYDSDMLGNRIHQASMEAGERWMLKDVTGKAIRAWDSRSHNFRTEYDELRRPGRAFVRGADPQGPAKEILFARTEYGEEQANGIQLNLRTRVFRQSDGAGVVTNEEYDFKGNLLRSQRRLAQRYKTTPDWLDSVALEAETYTSRTRYDALNRRTQSVAPHRDHPGATVNIVAPIYNEANLLEQVHVWLSQNAEPTGWLDPATASLHAVTDVDYNAKGQRTRIDYGNGARTLYTYDKLTFRLMHLETMRSGTALQDLGYTYDPAGNITSIRDDAQQIVYFNNAVVEPHADYTYDAIYRLVSATGREHIGQVSQPQPDWNDAFRTNLPHPHDGQAMRSCTEQFEYDEVGNILGIIHQAMNGNWTRSYDYNEPSLIETDNLNNRLSSTTIGATTETYLHDAHGNMTHMPHLAQMDWDFGDQLQTIDLGGGGKAYYVYDASGQRTRKVWEKSAGLIEERVYLGGFEIFRRRNGAGTVTLERETLHIMDDKRRIALVETRTQGNDGSPVQLIRFQFSNHLDSACLELDGTGQIVSYEEYYPYGSTSYQAVRDGVEINPKRYRYTGKERDEESGLYYHGVRYCAPWLGRWTAADPAGTVDGGNLFAYARGNPLGLIDSSGTQAHPGQGGAEGAGPAGTEALTGIAGLVERAREATERAVKERIEQEKALAKLDAERSANPESKAPKSYKSEKRSDEARQNSEERNQRADLFEGALKIQEEWGEKSRTVPLYGQLTFRIPYGDLSPEQVITQDQAGETTGAFAQAVAGVGAGKAFNEQAGTPLTPISETQQGAPVSGSNVRELSSIWDVDQGPLGPGARGLMIEDYLGGNLPRNFKTIDKASSPEASGQSRVITSIKSLNSNNPSYQRPGAVYDRLAVNKLYPSGRVDLAYFVSLAEYETHTRGGVTISAGPSTQRVLQLAIPTSPLTSEQWSDITSAEVAAKQQNISLQIVRIY